MHMVYSLSGIFHSSVLRRRFYWICRSFFIVFTVCSFVSLVYTDLLLHNKLEIIVKYHISISFFVIWAAKGITTLLILKRHIISHTFMTCLPIIFMQRCLKLAEKIPNSAIFFFLSAYWKHYLLWLWAWIVPDVEEVNQQERAQLHQVRSRSKRWNIWIVIAPSAVEQQSSHSGTKRSVPSESRFSSKLPSGQIINKLKNVCFLQTNKKRQTLLVFLVRFSEMHLISYQTTRGNGVFLHRHVGMPCWANFI